MILSVSGVIWILCAADGRSPVDEGELALIDGDGELLAGTQSALTPIPTATVSGEASIDDERWVLDGWRGMQGHNWGAGHSERTTAGPAHDGRSRRSFRGRRRGKITWNRHEESAHVDGSKVHTFADTWRPWALAFLRWRERRRRFAREMQDRFL